MALIERFEDIESWKKARIVVREVYRVSSIGEFARDYGLRDQIRRASVSIMSNIAEGFERDGNKEFINYLSIAKASCGEVRSQLYVVLDNGYISEADFRSIYVNLCEISRLINGLSITLKRRN